MTAPTQPVTCRFFGQNGEPIAARVSFRLTVQEVYEGLIVSPVNEYVTCDAGTGIGVINLFPNALGVNGSQYTVKAVDTVTGRTILATTRCTVPNTACYLDLILNQDPFPESTAVNFTGPITSVGSVTAVGSQTGTGSTFVMNAAPTLVTPVLGVATATSLQGIIGNVTPAAGTFTTITSTGNATLGDTEASDAHTINGVTTLLANSTSAALTVTQTGSGNAFVVEDSTSPDNSPFLIDSGGGVQLGHTVAIPSVAGSNSLNIANSGARAQFARWNTDTQGGRLYLAKANTTTIGSFASGTGVVSGDEMGGVYFEGANNSTGFVLGAGIAAHVDGTPNDTASDMPGRLTFSTSANGSATLVERMRIDSAGNVGVGVAPNAAALTISKTYSGGTQTRGVFVTGAVDPAVSTVSHAGVNVGASVTAGTLPTLMSFIAGQGVFTGSVTSQYGFVADSTIVGATNNYGFYSNIASSANRYNFYAAGTAPNFFAGDVYTNSILFAKLGTAIPAGGIQAVAVSSTTTMGVYFGSGVPTVSAAQGSLYLRSDGSSTSTRMYVNTNGTTGWAAVTTAS